MLRFTTTLFTLVSLILVSLSTPMAAQGPKEPAPAAVKSKDLKKVLEAEGEKLRTEKGKFSEVRDSKENAQGQAKQGWTKNEKIFLGAFIVGIAILVVVLIKYGKECRRTTPLGCNIGTDEGCSCAEYEPSR